LAGRSPAKTPRSALSCLNPDVLNLVDSPARLLQSFSYESYIKKNMMYINGTGTWASVCGSLRAASLFNQGLTCLPPGFQLHFSCDRSI
jgi:hypothetical protein